LAGLPSAPRRDRRGTTAVSPCIGVSTPIETSGGEEVPEVRPPLISIVAAVVEQCSREVMLSICPDPDT